MGLKFTPTPEKSNPNELDIDINNFFSEIEAPRVF